MTTYVLVHGAWHGGWCWKKTIPLLRAAGAEVFAPTLTGMGERAHLNDRLNPSEITLDVHIQDIVQLMRYEGLEDVVLVGHAYAGMVITGVAEVCPERIAHMVYVNGVIPADRHSMVDQLVPVRGEVFASLVRGVTRNADGCRPAPASVPGRQTRAGRAAGCPSPVCARRPALSAPAVPRSFDRALPGLQ